MKMIYKSKEFKKLMTGSFVCAFIFNAINFTSQYFHDILHFAVFTIIIMVQFVILFKLFKEVMALFLKFLPEEKNTYKRLALVICIYILITGLSLFGTFKLYAFIPWFGYTYNDYVFLWNLLAFAILNIFMTLLMEGLRNFKEWKQNSRYNENLSTSYNRSRLDALKSQVNPHFLFNSLNSLSSLIQEDQEKAEVFLDELSKIYRYMLRTEDDKFVKVESELGFINSYYHLLHARFGEGLQIKINVDNSVLKKSIAPHSLQVIIENAFTQNVVSKNSPLKIDIYNEGETKLIVKNNLQAKTVNEVLDFEVGLDNLVLKYKLLGSEVTIHDSSLHARTIAIPLTDNTF